MKNSILKIGLVFGIIILFLGTSITSAINSNVEPAKMINEIGNLNRDTNTFYPTDDASIKETAPYTNFGSDYLVVRNKYGGYGSPGYEDDLLIKFNISELSPGIIIRSATLNLFYNQWRENNPAGRTLTLYRITSDWDENTVTWNTRPSYASEVTFSAVVPGSPGVWMEWDVTSDVQDFVEGQENNHGWQIMDEIYWGMSDIPATWFHEKELGSNTAYLEIEVIKPRSALLFGRIENLNAEGNLITFNAVRLRYLQFSPPSFNTYISGEKIVVVEPKSGILTTNFAFGFFKAALL